MAQAVRYITSTTVKRTTNQYGQFTATNWANTHNLRSSTGGDANTVNLASASGTMNKPGDLISRGAQFLDIPLNARINWVRAEWSERCTNPTGGVTGRPNIPSKSVALLAVNGGTNSPGKTEAHSIPYDYVTRSLTWQRSEIPKVTPKALRSGNVGIHLGFSRNTAGNTGIVRCSFKRIVVDYTPPTYSLEASVQQNKKLGENLTYTVKVTNTNNAHNGVAVPVSINLPSGLSYVSQTGNGTYNKNTGKWDAVLSGPNGSATLTLTLKSTSVGSKSITATVDGFGTTLTRSTTILQPVFTITPNIPVSVVSGKDLTFTVSVKVDTDAVTSRNINVAVPSGFTFKSSTGSGSFNSSTGVWNAQFSNKTASRTFVYTAVTVGSHDIKITVSDTSTSSTKTVIILSPDLTTPYYRYYELPEEIKNLMSHGKQYTVSVDCMVEDTVLPTIYDGLENFRLAVAKRIENLVPHPNQATGTRTLKNTTGFSLLPNTTFSSVFNSTYGQMLQVNVTGVKQGVFTTPGVRVPVKPNTYYTVRMLVMGSNGGPLRILLRDRDSENTVIKESYKNYYTNSQPFYMYHTILTDPNAVTLDYVALSWDTTPFTFYLMEVLVQEGVHNYNLAAPNVATATSALKNVREFTPRAVALESTTEQTKITGRSLKIIPDGTTLDNGVSIQGDSGGLRLGMFPGRTYTAGAWMYISNAAWNDPNKHERFGRVIIFDREASVYEESRSEPPSKPGKWIWQEVTRTIRSGADQAFIRIYNGCNNPNSVVYVGPVVVVEGETIPEEMKKLSVEMYDMNLLSGDLYSNEVLSNRPTELGSYQRIAVSFIYDENSNQVIKLNGQYPEISPGTSSVKYSRFAILEGDNKLFEEGLPLFDNPQALIENGDYSNVDLDANLSSGAVKFEDVNFAGREDDPNIIIKGIGVKLDYHATEDMGVTVELQHKDSTVQKSQAVPAGESTTELGGAFDKWGLTNINLPDLSFKLKVSEINGNGSIFQVKNVRLVVYYQYDETGGNPGFIINGEHSRNYNLFLTGLESEDGMQLELDVLELGSHDGQLILGSSIEPKKVTIPFSVVGCSLSECEKRLQDAVKWMSNTFDSAKRPIPNVLSFDWDPDKKYKVILNDTVKNNFEDGHLECTAEFLLPEGLAFEEETSLGTGVNDGLKPVSPVITIKTDDNPRVLDDWTRAIVLKDSISGAELTIKHTVPAGETLIVDCKNRRIYRPQDEGKVNVELDNLVSLNVATGSMSEKNTNGFQGLGGGSVACVHSPGRKRHVLRVNVASLHDGWQTYPRITGFKQNTQYIALVYGVFRANTRLSLQELGGSGSSQSEADYARTSHGYQYVQTSLTPTANGTEMNIAQRVIQEGYSGELDIHEVGLVEYDDEIPFWRVDYNTGKITVLYDLSPQVTLDSTWPVLDVNKQYDFSESQGCVIQKVEYEKGV